MIPLASADRKNFIVARSQPYYKMPGPEGSPSWVRVQRVPLDIRLKSENFWS